MIIYNYGEVAKKIFLEEGSLEIISGDYFFARLFSAAANNSIYDNFTTRALNGLHEVLK